MKGWKLALLLGLALLAGGTGALPERQEMEGLKLVSALAVDGGEKVSVTALTAVRSTGEEEPETFSGTGDSLAEACRNLRESSSRRAYLGQTEQLLLGAGSGLEATLDFVLVDRDLRMDTSLYIVKGAAGESLAASAQLSAEEAGGTDPRRRTVGETLARLAEGEHALIPALAPGEEGALAPAGWAVAGPGGVVGYLEGDAALGAFLLAGGGRGEVVTLPGGAAELTAVRTWAYNGKLLCTIEASRAQGEPDRLALEAWGERMLRSALEPGWDCWGLDRELAALRPWTWEQGKGTDVRELEVTVTGKWVEGYGA